MPAPHAAPRDEVRNGEVRRFTGIAQLVEQRIPNPQVVGSSPPAPAKVTIDARRKRISKKAAGRPAKDDAEAEEKSRATTPATGRAPREVRGRGEAVEAGKADDAAREAAASPMQLGYTRFVYAAYMGGRDARRVPHREDRVTSAGTDSVSGKPELGEPRDEIVYLAAGVVGVRRRRYYYWRKPEARQYANRGRGGAVEGHLAERARR